MKKLNSYTLQKLPWQSIGDLMVESIYQDYMGARHAFQTAHNPS